MKLVGLLGQDSMVLRRRVLAMAALAGISNAVALGVINAGAEAAARGHAHLGIALVLALAIVAYVLAQRHVMRVCADEVEAVVARLRLRLVEGVLQADLLPLEQLGIGDIHAAITGETLTISQAATMLVVGLQAALVTVFVLVYVGLLSLPALLLSVALVALASRLHLLRLRRLGTHFATSMQADSTLFGALDDIVSGAKEIRLDTALRDAIAVEVASRSHDAMSARSGLQDHVAREFVLMQILFFLLLTAIVFIVPDYRPGRPEVTAQVATAMLFVAGSLSILLQTAPAYARASAAAARIEALGDRLAAARPATTAVSPGLLDRFDEIRLEGAVFAYAAKGGQPGFRVGPLDLEIRRGEVVFLIGGNGAGKSTLLKLLVGLYEPDSGRILVDDKPVAQCGPVQYRSLFSIILGDFHLFEQLYGIAPDLRRLTDGLQRMGLTGKTGLQDGRFSTLALSSGQRKRLAMVVAEQENRPILVLDEWAAEQDPHYRRFFYQEMIPALRERGVTVIAATHDDQYFASADRLLRMENGSLREMRLPPY